jgi:hypothetical protein
MKFSFAHKMMTAVLAVFVIGNVNSTWADDFFSVAINSKDQLVIFAPSGDKLAELNDKTLSQPVKIGHVSLQISYGRDANGLLTALLYAKPADATPFSFTVLDNKVEADKNSVVTLTFAKDLKKVAIDPGLVGKVNVNGSKIPNTVLVGNYVKTPPTPPPAPVPAAVTESNTDKNKPAVADKPAATAPASAPVPVSSTAPAAAKPTTLPNGDEVPPNIEGGKKDSGDSSLYLNSKAAFWSEPITPYNPSALPPISSTEVKLLEIRGTVTVAQPGSTQEIPATEGMLLPPGSVVKTATDSCVAAFMGGVNSVRVYPNSELTVQQNLSEGKRETVVDMKKGVVFANVGQRDGEKQDFKVKSAMGVAAAKGTAYVVRVEGNLLFVAALIGMVDVTDANGKLIGTAQPSAPGYPGIVANRVASETANNAILALIVAIVQKFNTKVNDLMAKDPAALTQAEKDWLLRVPRLAERYAEILNEALRITDPRSGGSTNGARGLQPAGGGFEGGFNGGNHDINLNPDSHIKKTSPA